MMPALRSLRPPLAAPMQARPAYGRRDSSPRRLGRRFALAVGLAASLLLAYVGWAKFEWLAPTARLREPVSAIGERSILHLEVADRGSGLRSIEVSLEAGGTRYVIFTEEIPATSWRGSGVHLRSLDLPVAPREAKIPDGEARLVVRARDGSWLNLFVRRPPALVETVEVDTTPPTIEVLTTQHYVRLGGSELVLYRPSADSVRSGVQVDRYFFPGTGGLLPDPSIHAALFAIPQDLSAEARPRLIAEDRAGNRREISFWVSVKPRRFAERTLEVTRDFLERKVPELLARNGMPSGSELLEGYLAVNRDLRVRSEEKIRELCGRSEPRILWQGPFLRQPNSAPLSGFADRRTYVYEGKTIDRQTHLGFDLASLRSAEVLAANDGTVVHAGDLGIYGDTVILDHGLGLFTLYGHLSAIQVRVGQSVKRGEPLGRTGETGLAAGDHLHFSTALWGVHVDPIEWWDPKWIRDHVTGRIDAFRSPGAAGPNPSPETHR